MRAALLTLLFSSVVGCANAPAPRSERDDVEQFLVAIGACMPAWFLPLPNLEAESLARTSIQVASGDLGSRAMAPYACVLEAGSDCARVRACYGLRSSATTGPCMGAPPRCEEDIRFVCVPASGLGPTQVARVDCASFGLPCIETVSGGQVFAQCASATCLPDAVPHCEGDVAVGCDGLFETREPAPPLMTCTDAAGSVRFVGAGEPCTGSSCVLGLATECDFETQRVRSRTDCAALGQACDATSFGRCFRAPSAECSAGTLPFCASASLLRYCGSDGPSRDYDCVAHGFSGCDERFDALRGLTVAGCVPRGPRF